MLNPEKPLADDNGYEQFFWLAVQEGIVALADAILDHPGIENAIVNQRFG
jgi:hypothetical protein